uniref:Uncharacterized protein n=1 Tax=Pyramimonas obovata TaxID=1411642 RepID=A0A7S0MYY9_9CHLO|mmetsp:Transcript_15910/g.34495  ORF Transcript_15910/g.34495 Transcript_15910/m.34495 type:complete len:268 (+) Transcript_15910:113-916(+)
MAHGDEHPLNVHEPLLSSGDHAGLFDGVQLEEVHAQHSVTQEKPVDTLAQADRAQFDHPLQNALEPPQLASSTHPVASSPQTRAPAQTVHLAAPQGIMHVPTLPDALAEWKQARPLLSAWLTMSIGMVIFGFLFFPGMLAGLLGIIGASLHLCESCRGDPSLAAPVMTTFILATVTAVLDGFVCLLMFTQFFNGCEADDIEAREDGFVIEQDAYEEDRADGCSLILIIVTCIFTWYSAHCFLSVRIAARARKVRDLLNPITSGVLVL